MIIFISDNAKKALWNYTALKLFETVKSLLQSLSTLWNYTALKLNVTSAGEATSLSTLWNYTVSSNKSLTQIVDVNSFNRTLCAQRPLQ